MATKKSAADEEAVADPHAEAFAERQKDARYDDPTVSTPGVLEDAAGEGPTALVDPEAEGDVGLDPGIDNRDQVQPMLDKLASDAEEKAEEQKEAAAAASSSSSSSSTTKSADK